MSIAREIKRLEDDYQAMMCEIIKKYVMFVRLENGVRRFVFSDASYLQLGGLHG